MKRINVSCHKRTIIYESESKSKSESDDICSEKKCAVKLTERCTPSIYCAVCRMIYCLKCMGI